MRIIITNKFLVEFWQNTEKIEQYIELHKIMFVLHFKWKIEFTKVYSEFLNLCIK